ncbi:MAG: homoserine dehydrogenase [Chloroflexi bacterium]|nr:homoserine dehydrogenase [Chloroflexota bacterium]MBU1750054.1 homoserine dehydrogenase [Chloroflexota bacterium]
MQQRLLLIGAGNVGRRFLELLVRKGDVLRDRLGLELVVVGVSDTSGVAVAAGCGADGLDPARLVRLKTEGRGVASYPGWGQPGVAALEMVQTVEADLLLEASPVNLADGQPALACIEVALARGMHVVTANKAPLVLAYPRLLALAEANGVLLRFDATVAGGLPAVNLGQRDLAAAEIQQLEGVLNLTTNYILTRMADDGLSYDEALAQAQAAGHAEANPSLDVEGWDAASKLVILANSVLGVPARLDDVDIEGITGITAEMLHRAAAEGRHVKLVATAQREDDGYRLSVRPTWLDAGHPLAQLGPKQMGIVYHTDICGVLSAAIVEETPVPTAAAMLRDVIDASSRRHRHRS